MDKSTNLEMEPASEPMLLVEWFAEHFKEFGTELEFITDKSTEGSQFCRGMGGVGGILRYKVDFMELTTVDDDDEFYDSDQSGELLRSKDERTHPDIS
jgi:peptide chain release factor subunit 1